VRDHNIMITRVNICRRGSSDRKGECYMTQEGLCFTALFYRISARTRT
jgi:hypothetical protein